VSPRAFDDLVAIGRVVKPQGRKGEVLVEPLSDRPERLRELRRAFLPAAGGGVRAVEVEGSWPHKGRVVLKLRGVDSIDDAERLRGLELRIPESDLPVLPQGSYYHHQLIGLRAFAPDGAELGRVESIWETGGEAPVLVVRGATGETLVPLAERLVPAIDLAAGTLRVAAGALPAEISPDSPKEATGPQRVSERDRRASAAPETRDNGATEARRHEDGPRAAHAPVPQPGPVADANAPRLRVDIVTIFPGMFPGPLGDGIVRRAVEAGLVDIRVHDLRDFTQDKHRQVDDRAFGGGPGMVLKAEPFFRAVEGLFPGGRGSRDAVVLLSPRGRRFDQRQAERLSGLERLVLLCGRYEGVDERVIAGLRAEELSLGDFVLTGGEVAALAVVEAAVRLLPGALGDLDSAEHDSFSDGLLDWPHYTRPASLRGLDVPEVLLSGHHERVRQWRRREALRATLERRPDLITPERLAPEERDLLRALRAEPRPTAVEAFEH
jgi:tRNA (guanine37-N1)-methyltransferase